MPNRMYRLVADRLAGEVLDHALQFPRDGAAFDQTGPGRKQQDQPPDAEEHQKRGDGEQQTRPAGPLRRPLHEPECRCKRRWPASTNGSKISLMKYRNTVRTTAPIMMARVSAESSGPAAQATAALPRRGRFCP